MSPAIVGANMHCWVSFSLHTNRLPRIDLHGMVRSSLKTTEKTASASMQLRSLALKYSSASAAVLAWKRVSSARKRNAIPTP